MLVVLDTGLRFLHSTTTFSLDDAEVKVSDSEFILKHWFMNMLMKYRHSLKDIISQID